MLDAALAAYPEQFECHSTEEMLAKIDLANDKVKECGQNVCVGSGDVVGLYPSLEHEHSAKLCGELVLRCPAEFKNCDYNVAAVFLAANCARSELVEDGLAGVIPNRKFKRGAFPEQSTPELLSREKLGTSTPQNPSKFLPVRDNITDIHKRKLLAKVVEVGVRKVIKNHAYMWKGDYLLQNVGVPTGLRLSGIIGRITMDHWTREMSRLMVENRITYYLKEKYVDDVDIVCENMEVGTRWNGSSLVVTAEAAAEDREAGKARDQITMEAWGKMASSIVPNLVFTTDCCSDNQSGTVSMLDFQLWREEEEDPNNPGTLRQALKYSFYEKPMANPKVMAKDSAMPHSTKLATLTQEGVRRLCNCSRDLDTAELCKILSRFMLKLKLSGYSARLRADILSAVVTTYRRKLRAEQLGVQPVHRLRGFQQAQRRLDKLTKKHDWFKSREGHWKNRLTRKEEELTGGEDKDKVKIKPAPAIGWLGDDKVKDKPAPVTGWLGKVKVKPAPVTGWLKKDKDKVKPAPATGWLEKDKVKVKPAPATGWLGTKVGPPNSRTEGVLFMPHTPEGLLARMIQKEEDSFSTLHRCARVKVVERGGTCLHDILGRKDPWARSNCGKPDCMVCCSKSRPKGAEDAPTDCRKESVCYRICCDRCKSVKVEAHYYGESARTSYLRGREHLRGQVCQLEENPLWKHDQVHHSGVQGSYSMAVIRSHRTPLSRQIQEATEIEFSQAQIIMNSRSEYNGGGGGSGGCPGLQGVQGGPQDLQ